MASFDFASLTLRYAQDERLRGLLAPFIPSVVDELGIECPLFPLVPVRPERSEAKSKDAISKDSVSRRRGSGCDL